MDELKRPDVGGFRSGKPAWTGDVRTFCDYIEAVEEAIEWIYKRAQSDESSHCIGDMPHPFVAIEDWIRTFPVVNLAIGARREKQKVVKGDEDAG